MVWLYVTLTAFTVFAHLYVHKLPSSFWAAILSLYYRNIRLIGEPPKTSDLPTLVVANHPNAFIDPFVLEVALKRPLLRTIRADWLNHWLVKWLVRVIGAVPLAQAKNKDAAANKDSFKQLFQTLNQDKWVVIFPEGISHNRSRLKPFKKGAAHIAKQFMKETGQPIRVIQLALHYADKSRLNSNVWVQLAEETTYAPHEQLDTRIETENWQHNIQATLPAVLRRAETSQLDWINQSLCDLHQPPGLLATTQKNSRQNSQVSNLQSWVNMTGLDLAILTRHTSVASLTCRFFSDATIALVGLPFAIFGVLSHSFVAASHYLITRQQSTAADKWASNSFVIGIPLYLLFWLGWILFLNPAIGMFVAMTGFYSLFYFHTWNARKKSLYSVYCCLAQPSESKTVFRQSLKTLRPFTQSSHIRT